MAPSTEPRFSPQQRAILRELETHPEVSIETLYIRARGATAVVPTNRRMQQVVGAILTRLNRKLKPGMMVRPGVARRTYRLVVSKD